MATSIISGSEIPRGTIPINYHYLVAPAVGDGEIVMVKAGDHPKMQLVGGFITSFIYAVAAGDATIEHANGDDATTETTMSVTVFTPVPFVLSQDTVFEKDEPVIILWDEGNTANAALITLDFVNVP